MQDTILKNNGKSKTIKAPSDMPATYDAWRTQLIAGNGRLDVVQNTSTSGDDSGVSQLGTALSKANLLSDATATKVGLTSSATVNDVIDAVITSQTTLSLPSASWVDNTPLGSDVTVYEQTVTITGGTSNTKVDVEYSLSAMLQMLADGTNAIAVVNDNGTFSAKAVGEAPTSDITINISLLEVSA